MSGNPYYVVPKGYHLEYPNREKAGSTATKAIVILLLLVSVALMLIVTIGGWAKLAGMQPVLIGFELVYLVMAFYCARWNRGILPVAAALAMIIGIFGAISGPEWFDRSKSGFTDPALPADVLGLVCFIIVPVQLLLIIASMRGFQQQWNVEVEVPDGEHYDPNRYTAPDEPQSRGAPAPA